MHVRPFGHGHCEPITVGLQAEFEQPFRLALFRGDEADHILIESRRYAVGLDIRYESVFVFLAGDRCQGRVHSSSPTFPIAEEEPPKPSQCGIMTGIVKNKNHGRSSTCDTDQQLRIDLSQALAAGVSAKSLRSSCICNRTPLACSSLRSPGSACWPSFRRKRASLVSPMAASAAPS